MDFGRFVGGWYYLAWYSGFVSLKNSWISECGLFMFALSRIKELCPVDCVMPLLCSPFV